MHPVEALIPRVRIRQLAILLLNALAPAIEVRGHFRSLIRSLCIRKGLHRVQKVFEAAIPEALLPAQTTPVRSLKVRRQLLPITWRRRVGKTTASLTSRTIRRHRIPTRHRCAWSVGVAMVAIVRRRRRRTILRPRPRTYDVHDSVGIRRIACGDAHAVLVMNLVRVLLTVWKTAVGCRIVQVGWRLKGQRRSSAKAAGNMLVLGAVRVDWPEVLSGESLDPSKMATLRSIAGALDSLLLLLSLLARGRASRSDCWLCRVQSCSESCPICIRE